MKKTNKTFKRFAAITSASLLAACAMAPVFTFAAEGDEPVTPTTVKVTINSSVAGDNYDADKATHTYTAYPIFAGSYNATNGLTITGWGTGFNHAGLLSDKVFNALVVESAVEADEENGIEAKAAVTFEQYINGKTDTAAVTAQAIEKMIALDSITADKLADILAKYVGTSGTPIVSGTTELTQGYYLVKDTYEVGTTTATNDALSKFILEVSGTQDIVITPKKSYPSVIKKVKENESGNTISDFTDPTTLEGAVDVSNKWNDVGDYAIGEPIDFMLYGSLPSTLADYTSGYKYVFHDKIATSLTLIDGEDADTDVDVTVTIDDTLVDPSKYTVANTTDGFTVTFNDIKSAADSVTASSIVKVAYQAKLNENAVIGQPGQTNEVYLEYSNNPEWSGEASNNTTDKTTVDKVVVFTYELDVTKVDGATKKELQGAVFNLYRGTGENMEYVVVDSSGKVTGWTKNVDEASSLTSGADGLFKVIGLDEGEYYLSETNPPQGYNALPEAKKLTITATTRNEQDEVANGTELEALSINVDSSNTAGNITTGSVSMSVENNKGTTLPGTGGIGTTIFYLGGGAMAAIGGIYLISKRRMRKSEE